MCLYPSKSHPALLVDLVQNSNQFAGSGLLESPDHGVPELELQPFQPPHHLVEEFFSRIQDPEVEKD